MDDLRNTIGTTTRAARKELHLTQEAAAERIGLSSEFFARIERGHAFPSVPTVSRMMEVLGVSADDLLGLTVPVNKPVARINHPADDPPEIRRLVRRLKHASPATIRVITLLVKELEYLISRSDPTTSGAT